MQRNIKKTTDEFKKEVYNLVGTEYTILDEYINKDTKIKIRHEKCKNIFEMTPHNFLSGCRCPKCAWNKRASSKKISKEVFLERFKNHNPKLFVNIKILEYDGIKKPVLIKNLITKEIYKIKPYYLINGKGKNIFISNDVFKQRLKKKNKFIIPLEEYKGNKTKIFFKCLKCNNIFKCTPNQIMTKPRCPKCAMRSNSKSEKIIEKFLLENNIKYSKEKKFENCKDKNFLRFDFYLLEKNILIEYDGKHHFEPIFGLENFKKTKLHDFLKNKFAEDNKIKLIRISFKDKKNLYEILKKELLHN